MINLSTIGFTQTSAENFFQRLRLGGVKKVVDVRLRGDSQLSGFAKQKDLAFFLKEVAGIDYEHVIGLAPTDEMLDAYKKKSMSWDRYELNYRDLISERMVENLFEPATLDGVCFLCSEALPHRCHRRVAAEYLSSKYGVPLEVRHL